MLPTEGLQTRYRRLTDSDAKQAEWDSFCDDLRDEVFDMDMEYLAAWFIDLIDFLPLPEGGGFPCLAARVS